MKKFLKRLGYLLLFLFIFLNVICAFQAYHFAHFYDNVPLENPQQMGLFEKAGIVLFGKQYQKSKVVDSLKVPHTNIIIHTEDGLKLAAWKAKHPVTEAMNIKGTIIMFHGYAANRSDIIKEAEAFYKMGWNLVMVDFRAHGKSEGNLCSVGYFEAKDVKAAYDYVAATGDKNIVLWGASMGAVAITKTINDYASVEPSKVILEMPFATMLDAVEGRVRIMNLPDEPFGALLTFWGGTEMGTWLFTNKPEEYAKKITCPVLLQWGKKDPRVREKETDAVYANLGSAQKALVEYDNVGHESLCIHAHEKWMQSVTTFLNK